MSEIHTKRVCATLAGRELGRRDGRCKIHTLKKGFACKAFYLVTQDLKVRFHFANQGKAGRVFF